MKKYTSVLAAVLLVVAVSAPAFANQSPKGTEGPDIRLKANVLVADVQKPKGTEGPDIKKQEPKGTEGPDIRKVEPKGTEGPDIRKKSQ